MPDVIPTIPQYPEQGIQAELDLVYLWNPNVANELIATLNELLEDLPDYRTVMVYKGSVATVADLPATAKIGDVYSVVETDENFYWTGTAWDNLGSAVDLTPYRTSADQDIIDQGLQDQINLKANAYSVYTKSETNDLLAAKQDIINDLQTIRSGAFAGATAVQPGDLATVATSGSYTDLSNRPTLGTAAAEDATAFASAAQGALADTAVQPADISDMETQTHAANTYATQTTVSGLAEDISDIEGLIPEQATTSNQLADKAFVNSSIATNTAYFVGTFRSVSALQAYSGPVTNNDYAFVTNDVITDNGNDWATFADLDAYNKSLLTMFDYAWVINGTKFDLYRFEAISQTWVKRATAIDKESVTLNPVFNRYKATVSGGTTTWGYEYTLNNSSFTADQWTAINSGITPGGVTLIGTALQPGDNVSELVNDAGYLTTHQSLADLGITATATELNVLDGITADTTELNYVDGVTSNIQTQLNAKQATLVSGTNIKTVNGTSLLGSGDITVSSLPDQTGQSGKFLTTDGTDASWGDALSNTSLRPSDSLTILGTPSPSGQTNNINIGSGSDYAGSSVFIGYRAKKSDSYSSSTVCIGSNAKAGNSSVAIGCSAEIEGSYGIASSTVIGAWAKCTQSYSMQFGRGTNSEEGTVCFGTRLADSTWVNYKLLDRDGTIPEARLADTTNAQQGDVLTLDSNGNAVWQAGGSGGGVSDVTVNGTSVVSGGVAAITGMVQNMAPSNYQSSSFALYPFNAIYAGADSVSIGTPSHKSTPTGDRAVCIGGESLSYTWGTALGYYAHAEGTSAVAIGYNAFAEGTRAIQLGGGGSTTYHNYDANTFKVGNANGNFEMMSADGTIPAARHADTTNATAGQVLTLDSNLNAVWATGGSGGGVSDVTVNGTSVVSGGVATITGMVQNKSNSSGSSLVWLGNGIATGGTLTGSFNIVLGYGSNIVNNNSNYNIVIGSQSSISGYRSVSNVLVGRGTRIPNNDCQNCVLIGTWAFASASNCAIINVGGNDTPDYTNSTPNTLKFCNLNGGYEVISADGTIPAARHADTTNASQGYVLALDSNLNAVWATPSGGGASSATATLAVNDWSSNTQTVSVTGVTASNNVIVAAAPASQADYTSAGILCTAQGAGTLTFTCTTVPSSAITVNVLII